MNKHALRKDESFIESTYVCQNCPTSFLAKTEQEALEIADKIP